MKTCAEDSQYCPDAKALRNLGTISIWGEGVAGKVHLEIASVAATQCGAASHPAATAVVAAVEKGGDDGDDTLKLVTFDGAPKTTFDWEAVNDPVMGGQSRSTITEDAAHKRGVWAGVVKIVPFLKSPGFCTIRTKSAAFPDVSGTAGLEVTLVSEHSEITEFEVQIMTKGGRSGFKQGTYGGKFQVPATTGGASPTTVVVPWEKFELTWRGEKIDGPAITTQLGDIEQVGLGTAFPGKAGSFHLELISMAATKRAAAPAPQPTPTPSTA